jgi:hypothetical protein
VIEVETERNTTEYVAVSGSNKLVTAGKQCKKLLAVIINKVKFGALHFIT